MIPIRPIRLPADQEALLRLDTSFTTDIVYRVHAAADSFALFETPVSPPLRKSFDLDGELDDDRMWEYGIVAELADEIIGFAALRLERWNRRAAIWHLYVAPHARGAGLGKRLIADLEAYARANAARCLWLETTTLNYPAIQFYRAAGFALCGLDQTLYPPESAPGETALYFARNITAR
jgi:ribosomal protein S18 acetylase RimI-like enzyme